MSVAVPQPTVKPPMWLFCFVDRDLDQWRTAVVADIAAAWRTQVEEALGLRVLP